MRDGKRGLKLTRENYAIVNNKNSLSPFKSIAYADEEGKYYTDEWCARHLADCIKNYDLNMEYFSLLNHEVFDNTITEFCQKHKCFNPVADLNLYQGKSGYYMMVLDEYCQVYIGTSDDIKHRVTSYWSKIKPFDRLLFPVGAVDPSIMSVDSFRAFDTTRIYVYVTSDVFEQEDKYISYFPAEFVCNRFAGGKIKFGLLQAITMMKRRQLPPKED